MKNSYYHWLLVLAAGVAGPLNAQDTAPADSPAVHAPGDYASDLSVVSDAQQQALTQARQALAQGQGPGDRSGLPAAIREMERAQTALAAAKNSPDKLPAAIAAEQAAYQALLKATPREFRMRRASNRGQNQGSSAGEPDQQQFDQLDLTQDQNRYETERQAQAPATAQQREQNQIADRLKELAQRQQDLNDRVRELQTALQAAQTDQQRQDIRDQLKRLDDEQRQMLANVDELRQQMEQSPNASAESGARQQLDQTRNDMQRASEELQNQSASQALAAGTRAQQGMQNLRDDLRRQTASQFSDQMRQMRNEARDLMDREKQIASGLDSLENGSRQTLDDSAQRQQITEQIARQQSTLTNLLAGMKDVTEQAETTEPLLSKQLYDTLRRADQMHTDNLLDMGSQLVDRGFLPQASEVERATRTNLTELSQSVTRAADSVLGSQADALRYAQTTLDNLSRQLEREMAGGTNGAGPSASGSAGEEDPSNRLARAEGRAAAGNAVPGPGTNTQAGANASSGRETQMARGNSQSGQGSARDQQPGQPGRNAGQNPADNAGQRNGGGQAGGANSPNPAPGSTPAAGGEQAQNGGAPEANGGANGRPGNADRLRQIAEQLGRSNPAAGSGGPITGNDYTTWAQQLRDVQSVLDSPDLRNQLATVSDRAGQLRAAYRNGRRLPPPETIREQLLMPLSQVQVWVREELARQQNAESLVPLDRDPVPENYSELVRKYYEQLGSAR